MEVHPPLGPTWLWKDHPSFGGFPSSTTRERAEERRSKVFLVDSDENQTKRSVSQQKASGCFWLEGPTEFETKNQ